ncbi:MAG: hypothetical protein D3X82_07550 [Candidatus Leucobacter sulfamidivorax]|nr:hypothetical protein [Candidatus Leucobacter sulfamidivorax]
MDDAPELDAFWQNFYSRSLGEGRSVEQVLRDTVRVIIMRTDSDVDLSLIERMPNMRELMIATTGRVSNADAIARAPKLRELSVNGDHFGEADLALFASSPTLAKLTLNRFTAKDLTALNAGAKLKELALNGVTPATAADIARLEQITTLRISHIEETDFSALAAMPRLRNLGIGFFETGRLANLDMLAAPKLISFETDFSADDESGLELLAKKTQFKTLGYALRDVGVVANCKKLVSLRLDGSVDHDLGVIADLPIGSVHVYYAPSREVAQALIDQAKTVWPDMRSTGWRQSWEDPEDAPRRGAIRYRPTPEPAAAPAPAAAEPAAPEAQPEPAPIPESVPEAAPAIVSQPVLEGDAAPYLPPQPLVQQQPIRHPPLQPQPQPQPQPTEPGFWRRLFGRG